MKSRLPSGRLRVYQYQHVSQPESWFETHSRHNWEFHLENLKELQKLLPGSCYEKRGSNQRVLCQIEDKIQLIGDLVITETKILTADNILFDIEENKICATVEDSEEEQEIFYYSSVDCSWKSRLPKSRAKETELYFLHFKNILREKNLEYIKFMEESQARREQLRKGRNDEQCN